MENSICFWEDNWLLNGNSPKWCSMELSHEETNMKVIDFLSSSGGIIMVKKIKAEP